jgi:hypothetical protein
MRYLELDLKLALRRYNASFSGYRMNKYTIAATNID